MAVAAMNRRRFGSRMGRAGGLKLAEPVAGRYELGGINAAMAAGRSGAGGRNLIVFDTG